VGPWVLGISSRKIIFFKPAIKVLVTFLPGERKEEQRSHPDSTNKTPHNLLTHNFLPTHQKAETSV